VVRDLTHSFPNSSYYSKSAVNAVHRSENSSRSCKREEYTIGQPIQIDNLQMSEHAANANCSKRYNRPVMWQMSPLFKVCTKSFTGRASRFLYLKLRFPANRKWVAFVGRIWVAVSFIGYHIFSYPRGYYNMKIETKMRNWVAASGKYQHAFCRCRVAVSRLRRAAVAEANPSICSTKNSREHW
jgi:hypothetical protein